jgi:hypothetical protein
VGKGGGYRMTVLNLKDFPYVSKKLLDKDGIAPQDPVSFTYYKNQIRKMVYKPLVDLAKENGFILPSEPFLEDVLVIEGIWNTIGKLDEYLGTIMEKEEAIKDIILTEEELVAIYIAIREWVPHKGKREGHHIAGVLHFSVIPKLEETFGARELRRLADKK